MKYKCCIPDCPQPVERKLMVGLHEQYYCIAHFWQGVRVGMKKRQPMRFAAIPVAHKQPRRVRREVAG